MQKTITLEYLNDVANHRERTTLQEDGLDDMGTIMAWVLMCLKVVEEKSPDRLDDIPYLMGFIAATSLQMGMMIERDRQKNE